MWTVEQDVDARAVPPGPHQPPGELRGELGDHDDGVPLALGSREDVDLDDHRSARSVLVGLVLRWRLSDNPLNYIITQIWVINQIMDLRNQGSDVQAGPLPPEGRTLMVVVPGWC